MAYEDCTAQQQYTTYPDYAFSLNYPAVPVAYPMARFGYYPDQRHPGSPDSISSSSSPQTPPSTTAAVSASDPSANFSSQILTTQAIESQSSQLITPLVPSSSFSNSTTERVKETIARANSVPMEFYHTEFLEYSKETYERKIDAKRNKRKRPSPMKSSSTSTESSIESLDDSIKKKKSFEDDRSESDDDMDEDDESDSRGPTNAELRRQIHIQSEQKRRAQIKDGFDELRKHLPGCNNKKMSKAALLTRTVQQIQHLKNMQKELLSEVERLVQENEGLKKFQHGVLQRQAMEKMYTF
ncbi:hypothetical protein DFQ28_009940 [Apophysomyces sp. BC1034]|nr:hypothetical protein DFQ30_009842 [Apophysomyces sp. BC1015]KAG0181572.1 hypothetical protein DFQ29_007933 [Apophysomyces sp. BC1021]KAG0192180.1 hypothetical protein DFQ28_009940 [Apophysomyces sp. BC1034]